MSPADYIGVRRARDLAFVDQLELAQQVTRRDGDHQASQDCAYFVANLRQAIGRGCSIEDVCRSLRATEPSSYVLDDDETSPETPAAKQAAILGDRKGFKWRRAWRRLLTGK